MNKEIVMNPDILPTPEDWKLLSDSATMLRQQQAEIKALKAELRGIDELIAGKAQEK